MAQLQNTFEGITDQATLTSGSSGNTVSGGDYFDEIALAAGFDGVNKADSAAAYVGSMGCSMATRATGNFVVLRWGSANSGRLGALTDFYSSVLFRLTGTPSVGLFCRLVTFRSWNSGNLNFHCSVLCGRSSSGHNRFAINYASATFPGADVDFSIGTASTDWHRLETFYHVDSTASPAGAYLTYRYFSDPTANTPTEEFNALGAVGKFASPLASCDNVGFGIDSGSANLNWPTATTFLQLDLPRAGQTTGWYGPSFFAHTDVMVGV